MVSPGYDPVPIAIATEWSRIALIHLTQTIDLRVSLKSHMILRVLRPSYDHRHMIQSTPINNVLLLTEQNES